MYEIAVHQRSFKSIVHFILFPNSVHNLDIIKLRKSYSYCDLIVRSNQLQMICQRFDRGQERWDEWDGWDRCELYNTYSINGGAGPAFYNSQSKYKASSCWIDIAQQSGYCDINVDQLGFVRSIIGGFDNERQSTFSVYRIPPLQPTCCWKWNQEKFEKMFLLN